MRRRPTAAALAALATLAIAACAAPTEPGGQPSGGGDGAQQIVLADPYEDPTLNPLLGYGEGTGGKLYDGLVRYRADLTIEPALATELPRASKDGLTWTAKLRSGVTFHDGSTLDAKDVAATFDKLLDPKSAATIASDYAMVASVTATGVDTVTIRLKYAYAPFLHKLTLGIVPSERLADDVRLDESPLNTRPVGTGPFKLAQWRKGDRLVMAANERYWDGRPNLDQVTIVFVPDDNTRAQRMRNGDFDGTVLPPALADGFAKQDGFSLVPHESADHRSVMLPQKNEVTRDLAIRRALDHAVDREGMVKAVLSGHGSPAYGPMPNDASVTFAHDPAKARQLLDTAGWRAGADGVREKDGVKARFTLMYPPTDSVRKALAIAVASDARKVGIQVDLVGLGWDAIEPRMANDALLMGGGTPFDPDLAIYPLVHSSVAEDGYNNPGSYHNEVVDDALDEARRNADPAVRAESYETVQRELGKDPARTFLVFLDHTYVLKGEWDGYEKVVDAHAHGAIGWGAWWNLEKWSRRS